MFPDSQKISVLENELNKQRMAEIRQLLWLQRHKVYSCCSQLEKLFFFYLHNKINRIIKPIKSSRDIYLLELGRSCHHATLKIIFTTQTQEIVQGKVDLIWDKSTWFSAFIHNSQILDASESKIEGFLILIQTLGHCIYIKSFTYLPFASCLC